jgi:hypothetical protein
VVVRPPGVAWKRDGAQMRHQQHQGAAGMIYPQSGWYMASTGSVHKKYDSTIGVIHTMGQGWTPQHGIYRSRLGRGVYWCLDNGVFTEKFILDYWLEKINALSEYKETCLFIVIPDVIKKCKETLEQFSHYRNMVKDFPVALVSQDGIKEQTKNIPWDDFDCLFVGGSDEHKLGEEGAWIIQEAKKRNKWVHVGRVNSVSRIIKFWQADSWDGTHLGFMPSDVTKFHAAVLQVRAMKQSKGLFDG